MVTRFYSKGEVAHWLHNVAEYITISYGYELSLKNYNKRI